MKRRLQHHPRPRVVVDICRQTSRRPRTWRCSPRLSRFAAVRSRLDHGHSLRLNGRLSGRRARSPSCRRSGGPAPMLKLSLFASRQVTAINVVTAVFYGASSSAGHLVLLQCQPILGYTATEGGPLF